MPKRKAGGIGSRTLRGSSAKSNIHRTASPIASTTVKDHPAVQQWDLEGKTNSQIRKKIKQLTQSRDQWHKKSRAMQLEKESEAKKWQEKCQSLQDELKTMGTTHALGKSDMERLHQDETSILVNEIEDLKSEHRRKMAELNEEFAAKEAAMTKQHDKRIETIMIESSTKDDSAGH